MASHVKKGRDYKSPLVASGVLGIENWIKDDLPDLLGRTVEGNATGLSLETHGSVGGAGVCVFGASSGSHSTRGYSATERGGVPVQRVTSGGADNPLLRSWRTDRGATADARGALGADSGSAQEIPDARRRFNHRRDHLRTA